MCLSFVFGGVADLQGPPGIPYFVFTLAGMVAWTTFSQITTRSSGVLVGNAQLVGKVYFPRLLLPISTVLSTFVDVAVSLALLIVLLGISGVRPGLGVITFPVWFLLMVALALGIGLAAGALMVRYRDVQYILPVGIQFLLFASPVAYTLASVPASAQTLYELNPLTGLLEGMRWSLIGTERPDSWVLRLRLGRCASSCLRRRHRDLHAGWSGSSPMSSDVAIRVEGLGKSYTIRHQQSDHVTLAQVALERARHPFRRTETRGLLGAARTSSFEVQQGEVLGIIGRNGAGKSTLLKLLTRITEPTAGRIDLWGRVGSLLEVGTGFHPELTGRENIYLNGSILGMSRKEIDRQFDAIVDFAGVEKFLDTPVKRYSSGMYVRLAFAVAAHLETEILLVDEVLAVGDAGVPEEVPRQDARRRRRRAHRALREPSDDLDHAALRPGDPPRRWWAVIRWPVLDAADAYRGRSAQRHKHRHAGHPRQTFRSRMSPSSGSPTLPTRLRRCGSRSFQRQVDSPLLRIGPHRRPTRQGDRAA